MQRSIIAPAERVTNLRWRIAALLGFGVFVSSIDRGALSVAARPLQTELGIGPEGFGWLSAAFIVAYAIVQLPGGYLLDRYGVRTISQIAVLLWSVAAAVTALAGGFTVIAGTRILLGIAEAPTLPADAKAVGSWFPRSERSFATSLFDVGGKVSSAIGIPFTAWLLVTFSWRGMFWATALLSLAFFTVFSLMYRDPSKDKRVTYAERKHIEDGGGEVVIPAGTATAREAGFLYLLRQRRVWGLTLGFAAYSYFFGLIITWLPAYLQTTFGVNVLESAGYAFVVWGVAAAAELLVGGWLVDFLIRRGRDPDMVRKTVLVGGLVTGLAIVGAAFAKDITAAVAWITIAAAGLSLHSPVAWSIPALIAPRNSNGRVAAIMNCLGSVAAFGAPVLTGTVVARTGSFSAALIVAAMILLGGVIAYTLILGQIKNAPEPAYAA